MSTLHIDFESRSTIDLSKRGLYTYARHPSTSIWCMAYAFDDEPVGLVEFHPDGTGDLAPGRDDTQARIFDHVLAKGEVVAHNAAFEYALWNEICAKRFDWPGLLLEQMRCTMIQCYAMSLPGQLEKAAHAVGLEIEKDMRGHRLMKQMAKPRRVEDDGTPVWWDDAERLQRLYAYCMTDVDVERALDARAFRISRSERAMWLLDRKINARGIYIDTQAIRAAISLVESEKARLDDEMRTVTGGAVSACSNVLELTDYIRDHGLAIDGVAKDDIRKLLALDGVPASVRRAAELRAEAGKSSTAKLDKMLELVCDDGRIRDTLQFCAAGTGRWGGRGIQVQNFPRPSIGQADIEHIVELIVAGDGAMVDLLYGPPMHMLASCLRAMICAAPGSDLIAADYSNIEGRVLAWLAGERWKLDAFRAFDRGEGPDTYLVTAGTILGLPPEEAKPYRQEFGKVPDLALGYQGGVGAFDSMATIYGVNMDEHYDTVVRVADPEHVEQAVEAYAQRGEGDKERWVASEVVKLGWRARHSAVAAYWPAIEEAAFNAVRKPGALYQCGPEGRQVRFRVAGSFLWCQLPSKRVLCYPYPRLEKKVMPWGREKDILIYKGTDPLTKKWVDIKSYGGKLTENVTQAVAADVLREGLRNLEAAGYRVVMHVHDEAVVEVLEGEGTVEEVERLMCKLPAWADGLPVAAKGWRGKRYRKD